MGKDPTVVYDYDINTDFSALKSYGWHPITGSIQTNHLVIVRVKNAVEEKLQTKGLELSTHNPDFLIIMYGGTRKQFTTKWTGWDADLWFDEGRIKLAFFDARSSEVIWWAETRADVFYNMPPEEKTTLVADAVTRILDKFPPNPAE
jgi:hypothetical protein